MAPNNESCATCFFAVMTTTRLPVAPGTPPVLQLTCQYDTPSRVSPALWAEVEPTDWCGAWSSNGLPRHRVENPTDKMDQQAAIVFNGSVAVTLGRATAQTATVEFDAVAGVRMTLMAQRQASVNFVGAGGFSG